MAAALTGELRLVATDPSGTVRKVVWQGHISSMGSATDKEQKPFLPLTEPWINPDSLLVLEFRCTEASKTIDYDHASTVIQIDATYRRKGEKHEYGKVLRNADFSEGWHIASANVVLNPTANLWSPIGTYTVEAGIQVAIGRRGDGYIYIILYST